jgi:hypothetical protein
MFMVSFAFAGELQVLHKLLAKTPTQTQTLPSTPATSEGEAVVVFPGAGQEKIDHGITEIGLERTRCLTSCPAFSVIIRSDGSFRYEGEFGVERLGVHTGKVDQGLLKQVLAFIAETPYFSFEDTYSSPFLDSASSYTLVTQKDQTKVIENYANSGPATLWAIETLIDNLLETADWDQ